MKDHDIARIVNLVTQTARVFANTEQLRERIAMVLVPELNNAALASDAAGAPDPVAWMYRHGGAWELAFADADAALQRVYEDARPLYAAPVAPAAPVATRYEKAREMLRWKLNPNRVMTADEVDDHLDRLNPDLTVAADAVAPSHTGDRLTDMKANDIIARDGYRLTGAVLEKDGSRCIVELSAVRWLTKDEMWRLMHPDAAAPSERPDVKPVNGIPATLQHDEGAIARCSYCGRYSLDPKALSDRQPKCDCGEKHGWSGSFKRPGPDAQWSGAQPTVAADAAAPKLTAPEGEDPMRYGDRKLEDSVKRLRAAYCVQQPLPIPDQMALVWRFDIGRLYLDWLRLDAWQKEVVSQRDEAASQPDERAALQSIIEQANTAKPKHAGGYGENMVYITPEMYAALARAASRASAKIDPMAVIRFKALCSDLGITQYSEEFLSDPEALFVVMGDLRRKVKTLRAAAPQAGATLTDEQRTTILDAMRAIIEKADELKAGEATFDGEWLDAEDRALYDADMQIVKRLGALIDWTGS